LLAIVGLAAAQIPDVVIPLTNENFEHDTQAATGQTTGHWFVLFNSPQHHRSKQASELWAELAQDEDKEVIFAEADLDDKENKRLALRFKQLQPPVGVLFRDRQMFVMPGAIKDATKESVTAFWKGGYEGQGLAVPKEAAKPDPSVIEEATKVDWGRVKFGFGMLLFGFLFKNWAKNMAKEREKKEAAAARAAGGATGGAGAAPTAAAAAGKAKSS